MSTRRGGRGAGGGGGGGNNVRGPTSALTEFLRSQGITPESIANRAATRTRSRLNQEVGQDDDDGDNNNNNNNNNSSGTGGAANGAGEEGAEEEAEGEEVVEGGARSGRLRRTARRGAKKAAASGYNSDELDEPEGDGAGDEEEEEEEAAEATSKGKGKGKAKAKPKKLTKAQEAKLKAEEKKKLDAKKKAKGGKGKNGDDDDDGDDYKDDEDGDAYTALSKSIWAGKGKGAASTPRPPIGSFEKCAKCTKQFTVTKYTLAATPGPGFLCHICAKSGGTDPFRKPAPPKRKTPGDKRTTVHVEERAFPTLVGMCIDIITKYIDDVEALGDIGAINLQAISKALSKNRKLSPDHAKLFYDTTNTSLTFHDATQLNSPALCTLVHLNPNLTHLRLDFCGQIDNAAFDIFTTSLPHLTHLELLGPFLIHSQNWQSFFKAHRNLESFLITQSPRFDLACVGALVNNCGESLTELRLKQVGLMDDSFIYELVGLGEYQKLALLDLSEPSLPCSGEALGELLAAVGGQLKVLDLSKHGHLDDDFLKEGISPNVRGLERLSLSHMFDLTDDGVAEFFFHWRNEPLIEICLARSHACGSKALAALLRHSGRTLEVLNINGWKDVTDSALKLVGRHGKRMREMDVSWCREMDDFVMKMWLEGDPEHEGWDGCPRLGLVKVWGCNKISSACPRRRGTTIYGVESHVAT